MPKSVAEKTAVKPRLKTQLRPVIPMKDLVVFPRMILPLFIARPASLRALDAAMDKDSQLVLLAQQEERHGYPESQDLPKVGVLAQVLQTLRLPDGSTRIMVECRERVRLTRWQSEASHLVGRFGTLASEEPSPSSEQEVLIKLLMQQFEQFMQQSQPQLPEVKEQVPPIDDPGTLADMIAAYVPAEVPEKQSVLECLNVYERLEIAGRLLSKALDLQSIENSIHGKIRQKVDEHQKEFFLREKIKLIREELGDSSQGEEYAEKLANIPVVEAREKALKEYKRLEKMPESSAESGLIRTYLDTLLELPWSEEALPLPDLLEASDHLDMEHYGLDKVKDRILEYLAVQILTQTPPRSVLCLVGPPGVGKTSLARSIAAATQRKFERIALGGLGDDAEIRGHRRTYVGAMPGRLIQALQRTKTVNTVILLDELDKLTRRLNGDPSAALLEVLDPEQNNAFRDLYLEVPFDLSQVMFVCAANAEHEIPGPLRDRLNIVRLSGYTEQEKLAIAREHLIPRLLEQSGMAAKGVHFTQKGIEQLISGYTREAGVRDLERHLERVCRYLARREVEKKKYPKRFQSLKSYREILGPPRHHRVRSQKRNVVGLVNGLAWTSTGGSVLPIEVALSSGKGKLQTTGNLGDVMKESMQLAMACVQQQAKKLHIQPERFANTDVHIHVPEGAIPKDGPSAGLAIASALASAFSGRPARHDVAMTGEITLMGRALPIGGLKEKALAAHREGIKTVLIPVDNEADLEEIPEEVREALTFIAVKDIGAVFKEVLVKV